MTRDELETVTTDGLDEIVHDMKADEAATINNQGRDAQIGYILGTENEASGGPDVWVAFIRWREDDPFDTFLEVHTTRDGAYRSLERVLIQNHDMEPLPDYKKMKPRIEFIQDVLERNYVWFVECVAVQGEGVAR